MFTDMIITVEIPDKKNLTKDDLYELAEKAGFELEEKLKNIGFCQCNPVNVVPSYDFRNKQEGSI